MTGDSNPPGGQAALHHSARTTIAEAISSLGLIGSSMATATPPGAADPQLDDDAAPASLVRTVTLVDLGDGALAWRDGVYPLIVTGRPGDSYDQPVPLGEVVQRVPIEVLQPNQVGAALIRWDARLNPNQGLREWIDGRFVPCQAVPVDANGTRGDDASGRPKRILLVVHGTFSSSDYIFDQLRAVEPTTQFLAWAVGQYDRILAFDHPTLSVSPVLNGLDLARLFAGVSAPVDVICHSRGGLVVRWWLEAFGGMNVGPRRVVFVAAPLGGTSLAAPARLRNAIDLFTTVGAHLRAIGQETAVYLPFMNVAVALLSIFTAVTGGMARTPLADAAFALVPGLGGMSRVSNNPELDRLDADQPVVPQYFAITSNFRMEKVGWKFWKVFDDPARRIAEAVGGQVFGQDNDLVVDTRSMTYLAHGFGLKPERVGTFDADPNSVFHTNYFLQPGTAEFITSFLKVIG